MSDAPPPQSDPISRAAAASVGYTPKMHTDMWEMIKEQINDLRPRTADRVLGKDTHPAIVDLHETAIFHLAHSDEPRKAVDYYDDKLGGFPYFGGLLGDYRRGLRITTLLMQVVGADYMDPYVSPAHEHNLYRIALGHPADAEQDTRLLLQLAKARAQSQDHSERSTLTPFQSFQAREYVMYEANLLQTRCDALTMQGKLAEAIAVMDDVLNQPREWGKYGRPEKSRTGSNPYARRALVRGFAGDIDRAFEDFKEADTFAQDYTPFMFYKSRDWHHKTLYAAFLARLGYLSGAQCKLDGMNIERIRAYRPLTSAEFDLASAEIAYARGEYEPAADHAERARTWGVESGHKHIQARAAILLAKVRMRTNAFEPAAELLSEAKSIADASGFALQQADGLILSGYLALTQGELEQAEQAAIDAETISEPLPYRWGVGDGAHLRARCAEARGDAEATLEQARRALAVREAIQDPKTSHTRGLVERVQEIKRDDT